MDIPYSRLDPDTLNNLIEEFVSREGTDYGHRDYTLGEKVRHVKMQLEQGRARICFDPDTQTCHIVDVERKQ